MIRMFSLTNEIHFPVINKLVIAGSSLALASHNMAINAFQFSHILLLFLSTLQNMRNFEHVCHIELGTVGKSPYIILATRFCFGPGFFITIIILNIFATHFLLVQIFYETNVALVGLRSVNLSNIILQKLRLGISIYKNLKGRRVRYVLASVFLLSYGLAV